MSLTSPGGSSGNVTIMHKTKPIEMSPQYLILSALQEHEDGFTEDFITVLFATSITISALPIITFLLYREFMNKIYFYVKVLSCHNSSKTKYKNMAIYCISLNDCKEAIKFGSTNDLMRRHRELRAFYGENIFILRFKHVFATILECLIHKMFCKFRINGSKEWYYNNRTIKAFIIFIKVVDKHRNRKKTCKKRLYYNYLHTYIFENNIAISTLSLPYEFNPPISSSKESLLKHDKAKTLYRLIEIMFSEQKITYGIYKQDEILNIFIIFLEWLLFDDCYAIFENKDKRDIFYIAKYLSVEETNDYINSMLILERNLIKIYEEIYTKIKEFSL